VEEISSPRKPSTRERVRLPWADRRPERLSDLARSTYDVNPLVVAGELGEGVDVRMGDGAPLAGADLLADQRLHSLDSVDFDRCHRRPV